jgi:hypothetical protein
VKEKERSDATTSRRPKMIDYLIVNLTKLDVHPGDTVVFHTDLELGKEQIEYLREHLGQQIAHLNVKAIILSHGIKVGVLRMTEDERKEL